MRHLLLVALCAMMSFGCSGSEGPKTYKVSGTVTCDGEPIEKGYIIFHPVEPGDRTEAGDIADGEYVLRTMAGMKKVEIRGTRLTEEKGTKGEQLEENFVPARYNTETTLSAEVTEDEPSNRFDFELESTP
jgi:hypothetical protein